jgi:hypothetical protein
MPSDESKKQTLALQEEMVNPVTLHSSMRNYEVTLKSDHQDKSLSWATPLTYL